ncbi:hypothetical protein [Nocardioides bruguierae]|uniref:Uncharacterized protein n=1 Tax=Nocardioides bruguierae TaxID=2945102 RepID=A0A9X2IHM4_9ACTN|nr:hypothetical protein [Nocardioides bruguierae]MCM0621955.1 hypothetical protein [Nocardioides bruguierae]
MITLFSDKGSPGCTTAGLSLAMVAGAILIEADPFGGDLAYRLRRGRQPLPETPTLLTAAALARTTTPDETLLQASHAVGEQARVVPGYGFAEHAASVDWQRLASTASHATVPTVVDVGRASSASPALPLLADADLVIPVLRPTMEAFLRVRDRLQRLLPVIADLRSGPPSVVPLLVVQPRHARSLAADLDDFLASTSSGPVVHPTAWIAEDAAGAADLYRSQARRGPLMKSAGQAWAALQASAPADRDQAGVS